VGAEQGTVIGSIGEFVFDEDIGARLRYELVSSSDWLAVADVHDGTLETTRVALQSEVGHTFSVEALVSDGISPPLRLAVGVVIGNHALPRLEAPHSVIAAENAIAPLCAEDEPTRCGASVVAGGATDLETLRWSLLTAPIDAAVFRIDPHAGTLSTVEALDFERRRE